MNITNQTILKAIVDCITLKDIRHKIKPKAIEVLKGLKWVIPATGFFISLALYVTLLVHAIGFFPETNPKTIKLISMIGFAMTIAFWCMAYLITTTKNNKTRHVQIQNKTLNNLENFSFRAPTYIALGLQLVGITSINALTTNNSENLIFAAIGLVLTCSIFVTLNKDIKSFTQFKESTKKYNQYIQNQIKDCIGDIIGMMGVLVCSGSLCLFVVAVFKQTHMLDNNGVPLQFMFTACYCLFFFGCIAEFIEKLHTKTKYHDIKSKSLSIIQDTSKHTKTITAICIIYSVSSIYMVDSFANSPYTTPIALTIALLALLCQCVTVKLIPEEPKVTPSENPES